MSDEKHNANGPADDSALDTKKRMEALARAIYEEMGSLTQEELEKLYGAVVLMEQERDK